MMPAKTQRRKGWRDGRTKRVLLFRVFASLRSTIAIVLLKGFVSSVHAEWNTYHGGADLRGVSEVALPDAPQRLWRYLADGAVYNTPVSDGELIFFSAERGQLSAVDRLGSEVWEKRFTRTNDAGAEMPVQFDAPLLCFSGTLFAGTTRGTLIALDAKTGGELWRYETGGVILGSPNRIGENQVVVLDQRDGSLHCIDLSTGRLVWKTDGVERCDGSPGVGGGRIVFGSCLAALHLYSAADGKHLKDIEIGGDAQVAGGVAVDGDLVFAGTRDGRLICADAEAGDIVWSSLESAEQTFSTPAVTTDLVIYASDNGAVYAVDRACGKTRWTFAPGGLPLSPVVAKDKVAVSSDGVLYLLDLKDGRLLWSQEVSDDISSPALTGGMLIVGADDGTVTAFGVKE